MPRTVSPSCSRRGTHVRLRAPDVHHRRRHPAADPADRDHVAVRVVRRLERRRELRPSGRPIAHLQPREPGDAAVNKQISHGRHCARSCCSPLSSSARRTGRPGRTRGSPTARTTRSSSSPSSRSSAGRSTPPTGDGAREERCEKGGRPDALLPPLPDRPDLLATSSATPRRCAQPHRPRAVVQRLSHRLEREPRHGLSFARSTS